MTKAGVKCVNSAVQHIFVRPNPRGGDIFIHTMAWVIFWGVQNFEVQYFSGFSEKIMSFGV